MERVKFIDLFCGIGGFRVAMDQACFENDIIPECVFSSDIDEHCQDSYESNFGHRPSGDITQIDPKSIPDHDILYGGFPCQPFSIIGQMKGFDDTRGTLFFYIANIIKEKRPKAFVLENVKQLVGHSGGQTLKVIIKTLQDLGYHVQYAVLNALDYGLPQKRERVIIIGHRGQFCFLFLLHPKKEKCARQGEFATMEEATKAKTDRLMKTLENSDLTFLEEMRSK